jgi:hypothetical protein
MRTLKELREQIKRARRLSAVIERRTKRILHQELALLSEAEAGLLRGALAEVFGRGAGTISRQTREGDLPVQRRLLIALEVLAPRIAARIRAMEERVRRRAGLSTQDDVADAVSSVGQLAGHMASLACRILKDGKVDGGEELELERDNAALEAAIGRLNLELERRRERQLAMRRGLVEA